MIYILLTFIAILLIIEFKLKNSFVAPSVILLLSFLMATTLILINNSNWDVVLYVKFLSYVFTAILSFIVSTHFIDFLLDGNYSRDKLPKELNKIAKPSIFMMIVVSVSFCIYAYIYIHRYGLSSNITQLLSKAYFTNVSTNGNLDGFIDTQMLKIITAIGYISFYQLLLARYVLRDKISQVINYYNILLFLITAILTTDRNILLRFFIYGCVLWIMFFSESKKNSLKYINVKIIGRSLVYGLIALASFYTLGKTKGYTSNIERVIGIYGGSGLYNFNLYLQSFNSPLLWGKETFRALNALVNTLLGVSKVNSLSIFYTPIAFKSSTEFVYISNIYSSLRPFLQDFGFLGMIIFPFSLGTLFEIFYITTQKKKWGFSWIFYAYIIYPIAYFTIADQFFSRIHLGSVYEIFWLAFFYCYIQRIIHFNLKL